MAITAISNSSQNMNEVAAGGVKPKRSNSRGVRIVGSRIYDSANGKTCHQVLFFFEILRIPVSFFLVFLRCGVCWFVESAKSECGYVRDRGNYVKSGNFGWCVGLYSNGLWSCFSWMSSLKFEVWVYVVWLDFWKENFVTHSEVGLFFVEGIFSFVPKENNDDVCDVVDLLLLCVLCCFVLWRVVVWREGSKLWNSIEYQIKIELKREKEKIRGNLALLKSIEDDSF